MSDKPPVTSQDDWESLMLPWIRTVEGTLDVDREQIDVEVDRIHDMTGVVAKGVQRSMAPISAYLVGLAVGRGMDPEQACRLVEDQSRPGQ
jgi:rRNA processing protein Krr1/Pno1